MFLWNYSLWGYDVDDNWAPLLHFAVLIIQLYGGFQVLAGLLPEDDGGRFPLCLWVRWFWRWCSASRVCRGEEISLMKNTCLYPWSYKVNARQIETFSSRQADHFMTVTSEWILLISIRNKTLRLKSIAFTGIPLDTRNRMNSQLQIPWGELGAGQDIQTTTSSSFKTHCWHLSPRFCTVS